MVFRGVRAGIAALAMLLMSALFQAAVACSGVTAVVPNTGPVEGGTTVTVTGDGFHCATIAVSFGGTAAQSFTVINDTTLTAVTPPGTGVVDVTVEINGTPHTLTAGYTYGSPQKQNQTGALQSTVSRVTATTSSQVVTNAVDGAIDNAFSNSGGSPVTVGANGVAINFAAESPRGSRTDEAFQALAYAGNGPARTPVLARDWSAWADLRGTGFDSNAASISGHQVNFTAGIGRKLTPDLLVGVFAGYETFNFSLGSISGKLKGDGATVGGYAGWRLAPSLRVDGMLGWTGVGYDASTSTASGSFRASRWLASGGLTGNYRLGSFVIEPSTRINALWENQNAWTDTLGVAQVSRDFSAGRFSYGGKVIYPWLSSAGVRTSPYVGLYGDYRFSSDSSVPADAGSVGIRNGSSARVTAGLTATMTSGLGLAVGGEYGGLGANYKVWTGNVRATMPF